MKKYIGITLSFCCACFATLSHADLSQLYSDSLPAVVTIHTYEDKVVKGNTVYATQPNGLGSGVVISKEGLIATASHVVHAVDSVMVEFINGEKRSAEVISTLNWADLALIKVTNLPPEVKVATLANSDTAKIGEQVYVIGAPLGVSKSLTVGYLSGKHPEISFPIPRSAELIQTDAAINPGNSGGPMFNLDGQVIGIASHIKTRSGGSDGLGFAVSSNAIKRWLLEKRPFWSGILYLPVNETLQTALGLPFSGGVVVQKVNRASRAHKAGLRGGNIKATIAGQEVFLGGDVIVSINELPLNNIATGTEVMKKLRDHQREKQIDVKIWRQGSYKTLAVEIE